jgi:thiol-disulfide isomerase/thioredoxin
MALLGASAIVGAQDVTLKIGDPAPPLAVSKWVKGTPVKKLGDGQVHVVEFWATWCGPCKVSIPHLTELAKKYQGRSPSPA